MTGDQNGKKNVKEESKTLNTNTNYKEKKN